VSRAISGNDTGNRVDMIDFAGLFSGTAVAPPRSVGVRARVES
jgi:hypothetical protein